VRMIRFFCVALATVLLPFFAVAREPAASIIGRASVIGKPRLVVTERIR
jgi:hypothetical protein